MAEEHRFNHLWRRSLSVDSSEWQRRNISSQIYGTFVIFSVKLTLSMQIIGFSVRLSSSLLWIQMYKLGVSHVDSSAPREADFDLRNSFLNPATPDIVTRSSDPGDALGGSIYDPVYYSSLFEDSQGNGHSYGCLLFAEDRRTESLGYKLFMSHNQSKAEKNDSYYKKPGGQEGRGGDVDGGGGWRGGSGNNEVMGIESSAGNVEEEAGLDIFAAKQAVRSFFLFIRHLRGETTMGVVVHVVKKAEGADGVVLLLNKVTESLGSGALTEGAEAKGVVEEGAQGDGVIASESASEARPSLGQPSLHDITLLTDGCGYLVVKVNGFSIPSTSEVLESPIPPSKDSTYWKGFLV
ncbi:hypothetical protein F0562_002618 [Nyssa sinensis]|uniref:Uncharacterized protein n=1 Tax=Nyssa sinensis TaxID=561372 RepID=A0A5J5C7X1_9ASTE|nr:hypothetical protein F0562_002618 [Nyssa sinensis]